MSFLCGCFGNASIGHDGHTRNIQGRANRIHIDPKSGGISKAWDEFKSHAPKQKNILILGLDGSGKTTLIHQLIDKKILFPPPSTTIEQYKVVLNDTPMILVDVPGSANINIREGLTTGLFALMFVIDWSDELRRYLAVENLVQLFFSNDQVQRVPLLVVVNKVDPDVQGPGNITLTTSINGDAAATVIMNDNTAATNTTTTTITTSDTQLTTFNYSPTTPELAAGALGLSMLPHTRMRVVCCSAALGWGINDIALWLNDTCGGSDTSALNSSPSSTSSVYHHHAQHYNQPILW